MGDGLIVERDGRVVTLINDDAPRNRMSLEEALQAERREVRRGMGNEEMREDMTAFLNGASYRTPAAQTCFPG